MIGGGTTAIEARILNRNIISIDVNAKAVERTIKCLQFDALNSSVQSVMVGDARNLKIVKDKSIDFVLTHPPYVDIIKYSDGKLENDLSNIHEIDKFIVEITK